LTPNSTLFQAQNINPHQNKNKNNLYTRTLTNYETHQPKDVIEERNNNIKIIIII